MKKLLLGGIWVCAVTSASVYFASWHAGGASPPSDEPYLQGIDYVKTRQITVPRVSEGRIQGYVIARFVFTVDARALRQLAVPPEVFVVDEAFRAIYSDEKLNFDDLQKLDLSGLTQLITDGVNERVQPELVQETLVEQFDFVPYGSVGSSPVALGGGEPGGGNSPAAADHGAAH